MVPTQFVKGLATYIPGLQWLARSARGTGGNAPDARRLARYCYSVWLRHLVLAQKSGHETPPATLLELGPGLSLGVGLAALLSGTTHYVALDVVRSADTRASLAVLDELVSLFTRRTEIPGPAEFPRLKPEIDTLSFPSHILGDSGLDESLKPERVAGIRQALVGQPHTGDVSLRYVAPWPLEAGVRRNSVDMILAQAVMQYVPDLAQTYKEMFLWLRAGGFASLQIDYSSHGTATAWDGHWAYSARTWNIMQGKRPFRLNRQPHSTHVAHLRDAGFRIAAELAVLDEPRIQPGRLAEPFAEMTTGDRATRGSFILAEKQGPAR